MKTLAAKPDHRTVDIQLRERVTMLEEIIEALATRIELLEIREALRAALAPVKRKP